MKKETRPRKPKLKRELGLFQATLCGVGIILGAGIYALVGKTAGLAGNAVWVSFLIAAIVAAFTGLSYAELSSMFPKSGAEYIYTKKAFGKSIAFLVGWLVIVSGIIASTAVALGFAGYFAALFSTPIIPVAIGLLLLSSLLLFCGIKQSVNVAVIFTIIEAVGLILIIFIGLPYIGSVDYFEMPSFDGVFSAAALIFFAFIGFEEMVRLSEETKQPKKTIPKALVIAIAVTTIIYMLVGLSAVGVLGWEALGASDAPLADVADAALPGTGGILSIIALFATANTVLLLLLAASRITYGMAKAYSLPHILAKIHRKTRTPWIAISTMAVLSILFVFMGNIETVANLTNFTVFITFIIINLSLIRLRYTHPKLKRSFRTPINIGKFPILPLLGILTSIFLLTNLDLEIHIYGIVLIVIGVLVQKIMPKNEKSKNKDIQTLPKY
jgi:basic amino acid/polyamine antiporter, APA family